MKNLKDANININGPILIYVRAFSAGIIFKKTLHDWESNLNKIDKVIKLIKPHWSKQLWNNAWFTSLTHVQNINQNYRHQSPTHVKSWLYVHTVLSACKIHVENVSNYKLQVTGIGHETKAD